MRGVVRYGDAPASRSRLIALNNALSHPAPSLISGAELAARFRREQAGTVRPALTIDDGTVAVTDNGLRMRLDRVQPRNSRVSLLVEPDATTARVLRESGMNFTS